MLKDPDLDLQRLDIKDYSFYERNLKAFTDYVYPKWQGLPIHYLEIGTGDGLSSCWVVNNILTHPDSSGTFISEATDRLQKVMSNLWETSSSPHVGTAIGDKLNCFKTDPRDLVHTLLTRVSPYVDVCYISGKLGKCTISDSMKGILPLLRKGAWLIVDDPEVSYDDSQGHINPECQRFLSWLDFQGDLHEVELAWKYTCLECYER